MASDRVHVVVVQEVWTTLKIPAGEDLSTERILTLAKRAVEISLKFSDQVGPTGEPIGPTTEMYSEVMGQDIEEDDRPDAAKGKVEPKVGEQKGAGQ